MLLSEGKRRAASPSPLHTCPACVCMFRVRCTCPFQLKYCVKERSYWVPKTFSTCYFVLYCMAASPLTLNSLIKTVQIPQHSTHSSPFKSEKFSLRYSQDPVRHSFELEQSVGSPGRTVMWMVFVSQSDVILMSDANLVSFLISRKEHRSHRTAIWRAALESVWFQSLYERHVWHTVSFLSVFIVKFRPGFLSLGPPAWIVFRKQRAQERQSRQGRIEGYPLTRFPSFFL